MDNKVQLMIYGGLLCALAIYGAMAVRSLSDDMSASVPMLFAYVLAGVAVFQSIAVIPLLRKMLLPATREAASLDDSPTIDEAARAALARLFTAQIITWALCESIAIYGLVLVILMHDFRYYIGFALVALVNFIFYPPSVALNRSVARAAAHGD